MRICICPGSFDPVTVGHMDIINRAAKMFDKVIVTVMRNPNKSNFAFTTEQRVEFLKRLTDSMDNIEVESYDGLLVDFARQKGAVAIVKGLRAVSDFEYEFQMSLANKILNPELETVFLTASAQHMYLSSSIVKQVASLGGDIANFVPGCILKEVHDRLYKP